MHRWPLHRQPYRLETTVSVFTRSFLTATAERSLKSFAYSLSALLIADGADLITAPWEGALAGAGMAALLSVLGSFASGGVGGAGPSLANEVITAVDTRREGGYSIPELLISVLILLIVLWVLMALFS